MLKWLRFCTALAIIWMSGAIPLDAQEVGDTIEITIQGNVDQVVLVAEFVTPPRVGDTIIFRATVTDEDGDPINAFVRFGVEDPTVLRLETISDSTTAVNVGLARGIALKKATTRVWVGANPVTEMRLASFRPPDSLNWGLSNGGIPNDTINAGEALQYCAYLTRGEVLVAQSPEPPACPTVFYPEPTGPYLPRLAWVPFPGEFRRVSRGLPVNPGSN